MSLSFERLENRVLLAVSFSRNAGAGIATVRSNGEGDVINVVGDGPNRFYVNDVLFAGYEQLRIYAGGGDDEIYVTDLTIGEKLLIDAGSGGDYVEILINIDGCKSDPCQFAIGTFRDASEDGLRDEIAFQLRRALEDHRALYAPVDRSSTSQMSAAS